MKATSSFKMPKSVKLLLATIQNVHERGEARRAWVTALIEQQSFRSRPSKGDRTRR